MQPESPSGERGERGERRGGGPPDRRRRLTPFLSRYWLRGRRRGVRRAGDPRHVYVDRYSTREWWLAGLVVALSLCDLALTLVYLDWGGEEGNPIMAWVLEQGEPAFVVVKIGVTAFGALVLLMHVNFRLVRVCLSGIVAAYVALVIFHLVTWVPAMLELRR